MNRLARYVMRLYPARWRRRYGDEMETLVDDAGADARMVADLLKGALAMQFSAWSFPRLATVLGLAGMLAGLAISLLTPVKYLARVEMQLEGADSGLQTTRMLSSMVMSRRSLGVIINNPKIDLYRDERKTNPLDDVIDHMRSDLVFRPVGPRAFAIQFTYPDKAKAQAAVQDLAKSAADELRTSAAAARNQIDHNAVEVIDPASLPAAPLRPDLLPMALGGIAAGLLFAVLWHVISRRPRYISLLIAGAAAGIAAAFLTPSIAGIFPDDFTLLRYESHAIMYTEHADAVPGLVIDASSRSVMAVLVSDPRLKLYASQLTRHTIEDVAESLRRDLAITTRGDGGKGRFIDISFTYFDRFKSQQAMNAVMNRIEEGNSANQAAVGQRQLGHIVPGSEERVTVETVYPSRRSTMIPGLLAGLALAAIIAMVRRRWVAVEEEETYAAEFGGNAV